MLNGIRYTPVLKGQTNDIKALGKVPAVYRDGQLPVIEMPRPADANLLEETLISFASRIKKFAGKQAFAADLMPIPPSAVIHGVPAIRAALSTLRKLDLQFVPVHGLDRETELWNEIVRHVHMTGSPVLFRLDLEDLDDPESTVEEVLSLSRAAKINPDQLILLADFRSLHGATGALMRTRLSELSNFVEACLSAGKLGRVAFAGSSMPKTVVEVPEDGSAQIRRNEYVLLLEASHAFGPDSIAFGDYGVVYPDFSIKAPAPHANAKIRYARGDSHTVFRGHSLKREPKYGQYRNLAAQVLASTAYMGRDYSFGDDYIWRCANNESGTGSLGTWVEVDMNHHLVQTNQMLPRAMQGMRDGMAVEDVLVAVA